MPDGNCPPSGSPYNRGDGSIVYPETNNSTWIASYILKNSDNKPVSVDTNFQLPKAIPMKGCVIVIVGGCGARATTLTSESHMKLLYDTAPAQSAIVPIFAPMGFEYGYNGAGGASGSANCVGNNCAFAEFWRADKDYNLYSVHGNISGAGFNGTSSLFPPQGNWSADFDYYLYKNCDSLKVGTNGPADFYGQIPSDAIALDRIHRDVNNSWSEKAGADKLYAFGVVNDQPVTGDWNGDGKTEIGNYKGNGVWALDFNGNGVWDGATIDKMINFGLVGDLPVTGDWNADGKTEIGTYRSLNFYLYGVSDIAFCVAGSVIGCKVCNSAGIAWVDTNSRCAAGKVCSNGTCVSSQSCSAKTCAALGNYQCGSWSDGCGGTLNCGTCASGKTCDSIGQCIASSSGGGTIVEKPVAKMTRAEILAKIAEIKKLIIQLIQQLIIELQKQLAAPGI